VTFIYIFTFLFTNKTKSKVMKDKILMGLCGLAGLSMAIFGLNKFLNFMPPPPDMPAAVQEAFGHLMGLKWVMPLVGIVEVVGGLLLAFPKTRTLGAVMLLPIVVGFVAHHAIFGGLGPMQLIYAAIVGVVLFEDRDKWGAMIR
jgi:putative oxidoreductase